MISPSLDATQGKAAPPASILVACEPQQSKSMKILSFKLHILEGGVQSHDYEQKA